MRNKLKSSREYEYLILLEKEKSITGILSFIFWIVFFIFGIRNISEFLNNIVKQNSVFDVIIIVIVFLIGTVAWFVGAIYCVIHYAKIDGRIEKYKEEHFLS